MDQSWSTYTLSRRYRMSTLDEITKEKQRISEALARVDAQREKLTDQLSELEATERVLAMATGKTQQEITAACKGARPNHVGAAISRHKRGGRIEERDGKLYGTQSTRTEQGVAVSMPG